MHDCCRTAVHARTTTTAASAGAAQTINKMLDKVDTRSAAITMLGKTADLCSDKVCRRRLLAKVSPVSPSYSLLQALTKEPNMHTC